MHFTKDQHISRKSAALRTLALAGSFAFGAAMAAQATPTQNTLNKADRFIAQALTAPSSAGWTSALIRTADPLTPEQASRLKATGAYVYRHLPLIHSLAVRVPNRSLNRLAALPFVQRLSGDVRVQKNDTFTVEHSGAGTARTQYGATGQGVTVAVIDSGIMPHADLANPTTGVSRVLRSISFLPTNPDPNDAYGHGTHVAGILAGNGAMSTGSQYTQTFMGIAPQANLVSVRVLDATGGCSVSTVIAGLQWVVANQALYKIRVINLSLGHSVGESYTTDPLCQAVEQAWKAGIVVVCAAGNDGRKNDVALPGNNNENEGYGTAYGSIASPGNDPYVITVGAMKNMDGQRAHDAIATYSGRGPSRLDLTLKPDIVAPGNQVISLRRPLSMLELTSPTNQEPLSDYCARPSLLGTTSYFKLSGTSMAAPVVAGAAALLLQKNPMLSPDTIKARLMISADKWADAAGNTDVCTYGAGYLNIPAALQCPLTATQAALSPALAADDAGSVTLQTDNIFSANGDIWGTGLTMPSAVWGTRAIWGTNTISSSRAVWGKSVWGDRAIWGTDFFSINLGLILLNGE